MEIQALYASVATAILDQAQALPEPLHAAAYLVAATWPVLLPALVLVTVALALALALEAHDARAHRRASAAVSMP